MFRKITKISIIVVVVISIIGFGFIIWQSNSIINQMANTRIEKNSDLLDKYNEQLDRVETETSDGLKISAWRFKEANPKGIVIVLHGMHGQDASSLLDFGYFFKKANYETFCLDMRAHGYSGGNRIGFGYSEVKDIISLLDWIGKKPEYKDKDIILYGISMGGATAINTAADRQDVSMVISASSFKSYEATFLDFMRMERVPKLIVNIFKPANRLVLSMKYGADFTKNSPINKIKKINNRPILLIHGDQDEQILVQQAYDLKEASGENVDLWIVERAKHMVITDILNPDNDWYRDRILDFIESNLN